MTHEDNIMKSTATHHTLGVHPKPEDRKPLFVNEPWLIDCSLIDVYEPGRDRRDPECQPDNVRIYVPLDLNREAILRRMRYIIYSYGEVSEENESDFSLDVAQLISQIEIYDQIWFVRGGKFDKDEDGLITGHSKEAVELVEEFVTELEAIPDACAECFPFETIDRLKEEYLNE